MSSTCATVQSNNYLIQTANMDAKVSNKMLEINAGREYLTIKASNEARLIKAISDINYIHREGWKIQKTYDKQIKIEDLRELGMNPTQIKIEDLSMFNIDPIVKTVLTNSWYVNEWENNYIPFNGNVTKTRAGYGGCCYFAPDVDKMACKCGKQKDCGCDCGSFGMPGGQDCNRTLNKNMFQKFIDRDIAIWKSDLANKTQEALNKYIEAKKTYENTPQTSTIKIDCCQSFSIGDILSKSVTIQGNNLVCNSR